MSRGNGTSGFSPVSTVGMLAFLISFSTNPVENGIDMFYNSRTGSPIFQHFIKCAHPQRQVPSSFWTFSSTNVTRMLNSLVLTCLNFYCPPQNQVWIRIIQKEWHTFLLKGTNFYFYKISFRVSLKLSMTHEVFYPSPHSASLHSQTSSGTHSHQGWAAKGVDDMVSYCAFKAGRELKRLYRHAVRWAFYSNILTQSYYCTCNKEHYSRSY